MKRYYYCRYTVLFITIHYNTDIVVLLNAFWANFHIGIAVIFKTGNNKPWKGDTLVSKQVIQVVKPGGTVSSWSDKFILYLLKSVFVVLFISLLHYGSVYSSLDTYCCYQQPLQF